MTNPHDTSDALGQLDPNWEAVKVGAPVVASDGRTIGTVEAKRSDRLHVRGPDQSEYLVTAADIASVGADGVRLLVNSQQTIRVQADAEAAGGTMPGQ